MAAVEPLIDRASRVDSVTARTQPPALGPSLPARAIALARRHLQLTCTLCGVIVGIVMGVALAVSNHTLTSHQAVILKFPGTLLLHMLELLVLPLVVASVVTGVSQLGDNRNKETSGLGGGVILFYLGTTLIAVVFGLTLVMTIKPGLSEHPTKSSGSFLSSPSHGGDGDGDGGGSEVIFQGTGNAAVDALLGVLLKAFPENIVAAAANKNFLGLVVFSATFGLACAGNPKGRLVLQVFEGINQAILTLVHWAMWWAPIGICSLIAGNLGGTDDIGKKMNQLYIYILTVFAGLMFHAFVILPGIYVAFCRKNPFELMRSTSQALLTALGTASSAATLPVTIQVVEDNAKISRRAARLVLPLGATVNMSGTALYEAVAAVFIAQVSGVELTISRIILIAITSIVVSIGATGIPEAGLITMILVLKAADLPQDGISYIITVDFFLDRCRTFVNVWGDVVCAAVVDSLGPKEPYPSVEIFPPGTLDASFWTQRRTQSSVSSM